LILDDSAYNLLIYILIKGLVVQSWW